MTLILLDLHFHNPFNPEALQVLWLSAPTHGLEETTAAHLAKQEPDLGLKYY